MFQGKETEVSRFGRNKKRFMRKLKRGWLLAFIILPLVTAVTVTLNLSTSIADSTPCDCQSCHGDFHGENWAGCSGCHDSPPQTGTHRAHYDADPQNVARYGDTTISSTADAYMFGCGNCHPLDSSKHNNGTVEVELYNAAAPAGSVKAKNPSNSAYTPGGVTTTYAHKIAGQPDFFYTNGTCNNVYCHSGYTVISSGPVGSPLTSPPNAVPPGLKLNYGYTQNSVAYYYIMDETCSNLTYNPYTVNTGRSYKTTPAWGTSGTFTTCKECHAFPLTTWYPDVQAGVGDSHQWVDHRGYNWRHAYNMGYDPVPCRTCHYNTVTQAGSADWVVENSASIIAYDPVPLASHVMHVNGTSDVAFDTVNGFRYYYPGWMDRTYSLAGATYNPSTKTCSNVGCHYKPTGPGLKWQQKVIWGGPNRMDEGFSGAECDVCHRYGYINETCTTPAP